MKYSVAQYAEGLYETLEHASLSRRPKILNNFIYVLRKNRQYKLLPLILAKYEKIFLTRQHITKVDIISASLLSKSIHEEIESAIGGKIMLTETTNTNLIAGLTILLNDSLSIDASAQSKITKLLS